MVLTSLFLCSMLASIQNRSAACCAVVAREHAHAARGFPTIAPRPQWVPCALPLSGSAATPDPLNSPPHGEGHPSDAFTSTPLRPTSRPVPIRLCKRVVLTAARSPHLRDGSHHSSPWRMSTWIPWTISVSDAKRWHRRRTRWQHRPAPFNGDGAGGPSSGVSQL
jgi:hypothetical protein